MITTMLFWIAFGASVTVAAYALERVSRALRWPTRWIWAVALFLTLAGPLLAGVFPRSTGSPLTSLSAVSVPLPEFVAAGGAGIAAETTRVPRWLWPVASLLLLGWVGMGLARLRRGRDSWRPERIDGVPVYVSAGTGPAVVGWLRPEIVVPRWFTGLGELEQRLVLAHEVEHVAARDPALLAAGFLACAVLPWHPAVWVQWRALRRAIETDCDRRVLGGGADPRVYGRALLAVAAEPVATGPMLWPAFAERTSELETRIRALLAERPARWRTAGWSVVALGALLLACTEASPLPLELTSPAAQTAVRGSDLDAARQAVRRALEAHQGPRPTLALTVVQGEQIVKVALMTTDDLRLPKTMLAELGSASLESVEILKGTASGLDGIALVYVRLGTGSGEARHLKVKPSEPRHATPDSLASILRKREVESAAAASAVSRGDVEVSREAESRLAIVSRAVHLRVGAGGAWTLNGRPMGPQTLERALREIYQGRPERRLAVSAAAEADKAEVVAALEIVRRAGVEVNFLPDGRTPPPVMLVPREAAAAGVKPRP